MMERGLFASRRWRCGKCGATRTVEPAGRAPVQGSGDAECRRTVTKAVLED